MPIRLPRPSVLAVGLVLLVALMGARSAYAQAADVDAPCGGYGVEHAKTAVEANNAELGRRLAPAMFLPREHKGGRYKVWREECSKLDLVRDLHAGWRFATLVAGALFMFAVGYAGILLMVERFSGNPSSQARGVIVGAVFGLLIVAFGMALWRSVLTQVLGLADLDVGSFSPFGMSSFGR